MNIEDIQTVKLQDSGYLVNNTMFVPDAVGNRDYQDIQEWLAAGNIPEPQYTAEELLTKTKAELTNAIQQQLDSTAQVYGYDSIISACSYAAVSNLFQAEGVAFINWRSACWAKGFEILAEVEGGLRAIPTPEELLLEMPAYVAPGGA
ncbi:MAG: hypothetical protein IBX56_15290 [Methylomicrobium sp.]|nr:hypothetical protein [Methylomicrobium sp.]